MENLDEIIKSRVKDAVKILSDNGLSKQKIANHFNLKEGMIRHWEAGRAVPKAADLKKLADLVEWDVAYFFKGAVPKKHKTKVVSSDLEVGIKIGKLEGRIEELEKKVQEYKDLNCKLLDKLPSKALNKKL